MYCSSCGKRCSENSIYCKHCGAKIIRLEPPQDPKTVSKDDATPTTPVHHAEAKSSEKTYVGLGGWLVFVGLGLIVSLLTRGYHLFGYFSLFNQTYDIPGYILLLQFEFVSILAITLSSIYLLYLYFRKSRNFPKLYIAFLIGNTAFVVLDHVFVASMAAPTPQQQKIIADALSSYNGELSSTIISSIIWIWYTIKSKRVKATFVNR